MRRLVLHARTIIVPGGWPERPQDLWQTERGYYAPGFRRFVDLKVGLSPDTPVMPPLPRPTTSALTQPRSGESSPPQVARVLRAVTEENEGKSL